MAINLPTLRPVVSGLAWTATLAAAALTVGPFDQAVSYRSRVGFQSAAGYRLHPGQVSLLGRAELFADFLHDQTLLPVLVLVAAVTAALLPALWRAKAQRGRFHTRGRDRRACAPCERAAGHPGVVRPA